MSYLASLLTLVASAITACLAVAIYVSPAFAALLAIVTLLGVGGAVFGKRTVADDVLPSFLAALSLSLVLATVRYVGEIELFGVSTSTPVWFVSFAVAPLTVMLLAAHFMMRRSPLGLLLGWWSTVYVAADALLQIRLVAHASGAVVVGAVIAIAQLVLAVRIAQRLLRPAVANPPPAIVATSARRRNLWTLLFLCGVTFYGVTIVSTSGVLPALIVISSTLGGMMAWRRTTSRRPADPAIALPLFLMMLALFYIHVGEEALTHFSLEIGAITDRTWDERSFTILFGLAGPIFWFSAALSLWKRQAFGNFVFWFLVVGMIVGEPTHILVFPVMRMVKFGGDYAYFSGMFTALFPMIPAIVALVAVIRDHRQNGVAHAA